MNYAGTDRKGGRDDSASIDRINPQLGYVPGNIQVISRLANMMKSAATPEQLLKFATWIQEEYNETEDSRSGRLSGEAE